jgi:hypothetical protein
MGAWCALERPMNIMAWWNIKNGLLLLAFSVIWFFILTRLGREVTLGVQVAIVILGASLSTGLCMLISSVGIWFVRKFL